MKWETKDPTRAYAILVPNLIGQEKKSTCMQQVVPIIYQSNNV